MKQPLLPFFAILLLAGCAQDTKRQYTAMNSLEDVLTNLAPLEQSFEVDPTKEAILEGEQGTAVYVPANAFEFEDGSTPTGPVTMALKECYSLTSMIGEGLTTTSGGRLLETGGMVKVTATADSKELKLKEGTAMVVSFPKKGNTNPMDIFYDFHFNDTISTWVPEYEMFEAEAEKRRANDTAWAGEDSDPYPIDLTDDLYDYSMTIWGWSYPFFDLVLKDEQISLYEHFNASFEVEDSVVKLMIDSGWYAGFGFRIDENGKIRDVNHVDKNEEPWFDDHRWKNNYPELYARLAAFLEDVPALDLTKVRSDYDFKSRSYVLIGGNHKLNKERYKARFKEQYAAKVSDASKKLKRSDMDNYIFAATNMGWINCDRFWDLEDEKKTNFIVRTKNPENVTAQLVFDDIRSIMPAKLEDGKLIFQNVPIGRGVKIIGVSYANGKPTMGTLKATIDTVGVELVAFNEFTIEQLEAELN